MKYPRRNSFEMAAHDLEVTWHRLAVEGITNKDLEA